MTENLKYWIWLSLFQRKDLAWSAYRYFTSPKIAFNASKDEWLKVPGFNPTYANIFKEPKLDIAENIIEDCVNQDIAVLTWEDDNYPVKLRKMSDAPMVLYLKGNSINFDRKCIIAMAGTRRCSAYGREMSQRFAYELSNKNAVVMTGVASGCDAAALNGAMRSGCNFIVLLPGGIDVPFESDIYYQRLYENLGKYGLMISPYPPRTPNNLKNFFYRNEIMTALCDGVLCVEAGARSGTLNVANFALQHKKKVFAIPSNLDNAKALGTISLICRNLAIPVSSVDDILYWYLADYNDLETVRHNVSQPQKQSGQSKNRMPVHNKKSNNSEKKVDTTGETDYIDLSVLKNLPEEEQKILMCLRDGSKSLEAIIAETELSPQKVNAEITMLTIKNYIDDLGNHIFASKHKIKA